MTLILWKIIDGIDFKWGYMLLACSYYARIMEQFMAV